MPITEILSEDQRRKRVWRRVQYLLVFSLLFVVAVLVSIEFRTGYMSKYQNWIENYGEKLIDNYEPLLIQALKNQNEEAVSLAIETLRQRSEVIEASLYDAAGQPVSKLTQVPTAQLLIHYSSSSPQLFVRELLSESPKGAVLSHFGYLRITLDRQFIIRQNTAISENKWHLMLLLSVFCLVAGVTIGRRFTKWRFKSVG